MTITHNGRTFTIPNNSFTCWVLARWIALREVLR